MRAHRENMDDWSDDVTRLCVSGWEKGQCPAPRCRVWGLWVLDRPL